MRGLCDDWLLAFEGARLPEADDSETTSSYKHFVKELRAAKDRPAQALFMKSRTMFTGTIAVRTH